MPAQPVKSKPFLRGHFHQAAFFMALGACAMLIAVAQSTEARIACLIYALSLSGLFGISALYHRPNWQARARLFMRKLDHSAIFVLIAGSSTPICVLGLNGAVASRALWVFWGGAAVGILKSLLWIKSPKIVTAFFYLAIGWLVTPFLPDMMTALGPERMWLVLIGGFIYTAGALVYGFKWPDPFPTVFGYHEIFHLLVVIASALHFIAIYQLARGLI